MKQFACTEGTFSFIKRRNAFRKGPHGTTHTASTIIVVASNSRVSKPHLSPLNTNIKNVPPTKQHPKILYFFPHKIKGTRNLAKSTVSGHGHELASACSSPGASRWAQRALTLPPKCLGGFCFPLPSCEARADPDGEDHRSVTKAGLESGGWKQRGREFRQEEQRGGSQVGSASCLSTPSSAPRPQRPLHMLRGGQVTEQQGWEQEKPCGMPGAGGTQSSHPWAGG